MNGFFGVFIFVVFLGFLSAATYTHQGQAHGLSTETLMRRARNYDPGAIKELGRRRALVATDLLTKIAAEPPTPRILVAPQLRHSTAPYIAHRERDRLFRINMQNKARMEAKISLARLGVKKYFDEFVTGLSSSNVTWQADCIDHLGEIGDKRAIESLIPFLNEKEYPPIANITISSPHPGAHRYAVATLSVSSNALAALAKLLPDEYANLGAKRPTHRITPGEWRTWLNQHRDHLKDLSK